MDMKQMMAGVGAGFLAMFAVIFYNDIRDNRMAISENSKAISKISTQVDSLMSLPDKVDELRMDITQKVDELRMDIAQSQVALVEGESPISLNVDGQKLADTLKVAEFIEDNYDLIVANRPKDSNKLDIHNWSRSIEVVHVVREILGDGGADKIKNVVFDEGLPLRSEIAADYVVREVYGIVLRDMIFEKELK